MGDHIAQKFTQANTKGTFRSIKVQFMFYQNFKDTSEVTHMLGYYLALHHHIINVDLNILAKLGFKHSSHHSLVGRSCILQSKRHYLIMIIPRERYKRSLFLVGQS